MSNQIVIWSYWPQDPKVLWSVVTIRTWQWFVNKEGYGDSLQLQGEYCDCSGSATLPDRYIVIGNSFTRYWKFWKYRFKWSFRWNYEIFVLIFYFFYKWMSVLSTVQISVNFHTIVWYILAVYEPDLIPSKYFCTAGILSQFISELFFQVLPKRSQNWTLYSLVRSQSTAGLIQRAPRWNLHQHSDFWWGEGLRPGFWLLGLIAI